MTARKVYPSIKPVLPAFELIPTQPAMPPNDRFPALVMAFAEKTGKTPFKWWLEGSTVCILWTDFSKDRFDPA